MIKSLITDVKNGNSAHIDVDQDYGNALIVSTREQKKYFYAFKFFLNDFYGINMNKNGEINPSISELIYDENVGTPAEWDWSILSGSWDLSSTVQKHSGSVSIDGRDTGDNDTIQGDSGTSFDSSSYINLTGYVYLTKWKLTPGTNELNIFGWNTSTSTIVGKKVDITDYISPVLFGSWQKFIIPLSDMELTNENINAVRIEQINTLGVSNEFFLDEIDFEGVASGGPLDYIVTPTINSKLYVHNIYITFVDNYSGLVENGTMPKLPYNSFLGVGPLSSGILFRVFQDGSTAYGIVFRNLFDVMSFTRSTISDYGSDGVNSWFKINFPFDPPIVLDYNKGDKIVTTIRDDLSGLLGMRATLNGRTEYYI